MKAATKSELRREITELRSVGTQMSNICFNLSQASAPRNLVQSELDSMRECQIKWDTIKHAEMPR